jgi:hypothetical protein
MLADPHPRANNNGTHIREVQHPSRGNVRDAYLDVFGAVFVRDVAERFEEGLEEGPVAPCLDYAVVLVHSVLARNACLIFAEGSEDFYAHLALTWGD